MCTPATPATPVAPDPPCQQKALLWRPVSFGYIEIVVTAELRNTDVDLTGLMRVLGEALYSTPHVAVRELVQNAHDSLERRRIEDTLPEQPAIRITTHAALGKLEIEDNGAGLTEHEIHRYLATV